MFEFSFISGYLGSSVAISTSENNNQERK